MNRTSMRALDRALEIKGDEDDGQAVVTKALNDFREAVETRLAAVETKSGDSVKLVDRLDKLEAKFNRPTAANSNVPAADNDNNVEHKALALMIRTGSDLEIKAAASDSDPSGGYFVLPTVDLTIRNLMTDLSPLRGMAEVVNISTDHYERFYSLGKRGAQWVDLDALRGRQCWLAVDLSSTTDLTAIVAAWRDGDGGYVVVPWFFCPADALRARADRDGVPYPLWRDAGLITATPGNVVDYDYVEQRIRDLCDEFDVQEIAFDPHLARQTITRLLAGGLPAVEMRQGWVTMAPAIKELERAIIAGKFQHGGHPVLRWNFSNIAVEINKAGNQTFHKGKSTDRIDGAQAAAMAVGRAFAGETNVSVYNRPDHTGLFIG